jgi:hypothetical protein
MACFGWVSTDTGRPRLDDTISATSGMREEPPTNTTVFRSSGEIPAEAIARRRASTVSRSVGRIIVSNSPRVRRTWLCTPGSMTATVASLSAESASLAPTQSWRSRNTALCTWGSS